MTITKQLRNHIRYFNKEGSYWYFTKARAVRAASLSKIIYYHQVLKEKVIDKEKAWGPQTQLEYANLVAPGSTLAWARELKTLFNLLGTAWVEGNTKVKLTATGEALLAGDDPQRLLEKQVIKYQINNPELSSGTSASRVDKVELIPHKVLLEVLFSSYPRPLTKDEFIIFISRILGTSNFKTTLSLLEEYRAMSDLEKNSFKHKLDSDLFQKIGRIFPYAAHFLAFPSYLEYSPGQIRIIDKRRARRILRWYRNGNDTHIEFSTRKDWFSYYGAIDATPNSVLAIDYYRKTGRVQEAVRVYRRANRKGLLLDDDEHGFECRVQGEAALEAWLAQNLQKLEKGLTLKARQYETEVVGRIDILARDAQRGYVVVELKRDKASDSALGQILRYIGWVRYNLLSSGETVRGYVVGERFDDKITYALLSNDAIAEMCRLIDYSKLGVRLDVSKSEEGCEAQVVEISA